MIETETAVAERFAKETASHEMTVLRDDGLYRHVRFRHVETDEQTGKRQVSSFYWFDLLTWPGRLVIDGDCGTFVFARVDDMFEFFRGHRTNPQYWAEKVQGDTRTRSYSERQFRRQVAEHCAEVIRAGDAPRRLGKAIREALRDSDAYFEAGANQFLADFEYTTYSARCSCGATAGFLTERDIYQWQYRDHGEHRVTLTETGRFRFGETWEWDLTDWDWTFLWCCHAIQWGIREYDQARTAAHA